MKEQVTPDPAWDERARDRARSQLVGVCNTVSLV